jgi:hypothetical protein
MKAFDFSGLQEKLARAQQRLETEEPGLEPDDRLCRCGQCDGYGHVQTPAGMKPCPEHLRDLYRREIDRRMQGRWEDWPPPLFSEMRSRPGFVETPSFRATERFWVEIQRDSTPRGLMLIGGHGRSKTLSALILCREATEKGCNVLMFRFPDLVHTYKRGLEADSERERLLQGVRNARLVIVDEYGRQAHYGNPEHARVALDEIVSACYRLRHLLLTSNLTKQELLEVLEPNVVSRFSRNAGYLEMVEEPFEQDLRRLR